MKKIVYFLVLLFVGCNPATKTHFKHQNDAVKTSTVTDDTYFSSINDDKIFENSDSAFSDTAPVNSDDWRDSPDSNDNFQTDEQHIDFDDFDSNNDISDFDDTDDNINFDDSRFNDNDIDYVYDDFEQDSSFDDDTDFVSLQDWDASEDDTDDKQIVEDDHAIQGNEDDNTVDDISINDQDSQDSQDSIDQQDSLPLPNLNQLTLLSHIDPLKDQPTKYTGTGTYADFCKNDTYLVLPIQQVPTQFAPSNFHSVKISHLAIVLDISDPAKPVVINDIPANTTPSVAQKDPGALDCAFKDNFMFLAGHHLYTSVFEVSNTNASLVNTYYYENHTLFVEKNKLYFASFDSSSIATIVDITNPYLSQPPITQFMLSANMTHDVTAINDIAFYALWHGGFRIVNTSDKLVSPTTIGTITPLTGDAFHNTWPSKDQKYLFTSEERVDGGMAIYDISNLNNIKFVTRFNIPGTMLHNVVIVDHFAFIAHYKEGLVILDISDPTHPIQINQFDTYKGFSHISGNIGPWIGAWGIIVEKESDFIYRIFIADTDSGAFIFRYYQ